MEPTQIKFAEQHIPIKFSDIKQKLQEALEERIKISPLPGEEGFFLMEGIIPLDIIDKIPTGQYFGEKYIPMIAIVGKKSFQFYMFPLGLLLPDIGI